MDKSIRSQILSIIGESIQNIWATCETTYDYMISQPEEFQEEIFTVFLKDIDIRDLEIEDSEEAQNYGEHEESYSIVTATVEKLLRNLFNKHVTEKEFYHKLWLKMNDEDLFPTKEDRISFLLTLWIDIRLPYIQLDNGIRMEQDEFSQLAGKLVEPLKKASYIIHQPIEQKTEEASLLVALSKKIEDERELAVFWAIVINMAVERKERQVSNAPEPDADD